MRECRPLAARTAAALHCGRYTCAATLCDPLLESGMRRSILATAVIAAVVLAGCGGAAKPAATTSAATSPPAPAAAAGGDQFGGDVCTALTKAEVEAATYPQGAAVFDSTDTQKDATTGKAVVCQYLVSFGGKPSTVAVAVSLLDDTEYATHTEASLVAPAVAAPGIGSEAFLVQPAPGLFEVWVSGGHGKFKLGAQAKDTAVALATIAAPRD
jgi:hypothetical protein